MNYYILIIALISLCLLVSIYYNYKFARIILKIEDAVEESLDSLDEKYASIQKVLDTPLFFDSPQVRQVIQDITESRNAVLHVANQLMDINDGKKEED
jgi:hypothetical protein|tara:strand:+ start:1750 stop:2043 length:294 start_codon:yes stop_codon:yes gene_type:complete